MRLLLRRVRGVLATALTWAATWGLVGTVIFVAQAFRYQREWDPWRDGGYGRLILISLLFFGTWGAISGGVFALALSIAERRRTVSDLSMRRVVAWGMLGGVTLPLIGVLLSDLGDLPSIAGLATLFTITALLGGLSAGGTLALARGKPEAVQL